MSREMGRQADLARAGQGAAGAAVSARGRQVVGISTRFIAPRAARRMRHSRA